MFISNDGIEIGVADLRPWRKRKALVIQHGAAIQILAYFRNDMCAEEFDNFLRSIASAESIAEEDKYEKD